MTEEKRVLPKFHDGSAELKDVNGKIGHTANYWSWAHSDLMGNTERGILAEYIVACSLGIEKQEREEWAPYDLLSKEGIKIEVKSSGYLQTWGQKKLSSPVFGIQKTYAWDPETNTYEKEKKRQADVYVFCLHVHTVPESANPLDLSQWKFYILSTRLLNEKAKNQKQISLNSLLRLGAIECLFSELHSSILRIMEKEEAK